MMKKLSYLFLLFLFISCESSPEQLLVDAIEEKDKNKIKEMLDSGVDPNADASGMMGDGTTATFEAACTGDMEIFNMLLEAGGKVDHVMEFGTKKIRIFNKLAFTIGHKMANCDFRDEEEVNDYIAMVDKVVELGGDIGSKPNLDINNVGDFDIHIETEYDSKNAFYTVAANSSFGDDDIDDKCIPYMKSMLKAFLKHGSDIDASDSWARTPLIYHVEGENIKMIKILLELGADINQTGGDMSATPLWYAKNIDYSNYNSDETTYIQILENDNELTDFLISKGAIDECGTCY